MAINDEVIRSAAFSRVRLLESFYGDSIPWAEIEKGVMVEGQRVRLASKAEGIFNSMEFEIGASSAKTTM